MFYFINTLAVKFASVLAMKNDETMLEMFDIIEAFRLRKFLGSTKKVSEPL